MIAAERSFLRQSGKVADNRFFTEFIAGRTMATESTFTSSDSGRSGQPLRHAKQVAFAEPLDLERGDCLPAVTVAYETYGRLNERRDNAVLVCHALSGDSHVARHDEQDDPGWWDLVVGPGKSIDTRRYFVICPNILGGCRGATGPNSTDPRTGRPYGGDFPVITVGDMVQVQKRLVDHLGIERLRAVVGGSLGGHMALTWAIRHPASMAGVVALATSPRLTSQALAFDVVGRNAILRDPAYQDGQYYGAAAGPAVGLSLARMLGHITYLSREAMMQKFDAERLAPRQILTQFENKFSVGSYLAYQGDKFVERFDANSYLTLTMAMDLFELGETPEKLAAALAVAQCRWLALSFTSDWLFPAFQSQEMVDALIAGGKPVSYCNVGATAAMTPSCWPKPGLLWRDDPRLSGPSGRCGLGCGCRHDAPPADDEPYSPTPPAYSIAAAWTTIRSGVDSRRGQRARPGLRHRGAACPAARSRPAAAMGIELDQGAILACIRRGLDVVQADLNRGLAAFPDRQFAEIACHGQRLAAQAGADMTIALNIGAHRAVIRRPRSAAWHRHRPQRPVWRRLPKKILASRKRKDRSVR